MIVKIGEPGTNKNLITFDFKLILPSVRFSIDRGKLLKSKVVMLEGSS